MNEGKNVYNYKMYVQALKKSHKYCISLTTYSFCHNMIDFS